MTFLIGNYEFEGPFEDVSKLKERPGLYAVLYCEEDDYFLIRLSQSDNVRERIELSPSSRDLSLGAAQIVACYTENCGQRQRRAMVEETLLALDGFGEDDCISAQCIVRSAS